MLTLKASVAVAILAGTALASAGAGYAVSRTTMTAQVAVACPTPVVQPERPWSLPPGPTPDIYAGKRY
ncbi:MAG: hypothetical protein ACRYG8_22765 [Janthinobacterium lividum]